MSIIAQARALLRWAAQIGLPRGGKYRIYKNDGAGGAISYAARINKRETPAWPTGQGPRGCGHGPCGSGGAGHGYYGVGCGNGMAGQGPCGRGTRTLRARTPKINDGTYDFAIRAVDQNGNQETTGATATSVAIAGTPDPPTDLAASAYAAETGLTLTWTLSTDDEAA